EHESDERLRQRLHADEPARGDILKETADEAGATADLGAAAEREQDYDDERDVGRDVAETQRRRERGAGETASEDGQHEEGLHASAVRRKRGGDVLLRVAGEQQDLV